MPRIPAQAAIIALLPALSAQSTIFPPDRDQLEGSSSTSYPLGRHDSRYQQIYAGSPTSLVLNGHSYRRDALGRRGQVDSFRCLMEISLSASPNDPAGASSTFADNVGPNPVTVLPQGWITFATTDLPPQPPASFEFTIPYAFPYVWPSSSDLCVDISIEDNELSTGTGKNFSPAIDAQALFASSRNVQPGYDFGIGCPAFGSSKAASVEFEVRNTGPGFELFIDSRDGVPSLPGLPAQSYLLLSWNRIAAPWPIGTTCTLYGDPVIVHLLPGDNGPTGDWRGSVAAGNPNPYFEAIGQIATRNTVTGELVFSQGSRLIAPPPGLGITTSRVANGSDHSALTGTVSFVIPVTRFF